MGRPPVYRTCPACGQPRTAREFGSKANRRCITCRENDVPLPVGSTSAYRDVVQEHIAGITDASSLFESQRVAASTAAQIFAPLHFAVCQCCRAPDVSLLTPGAPTTMRNVSGYTLCIVCAYQVAQCGRCETHKSAVLVPELASNVVPMVPIEIIEMMQPRPSPPAEARERDDASTLVPAIAG